jgi:hypothetical protein
MQKKSIVNERDEREAGEPLGDDPFAADMSSILMKAD